MTRNKVKRNRAPPPTVVKKDRNQSSSVTAFANVVQILESNDFESNMTSDSTTSTVHSRSNSVSSQKSINGDQKYTTTKTTQPRILPIIL